MDWLVGCGDHEDCLLAHERRALCYIPLHSIWLMTFMLFASTSYLTCTQHTSEFQNVKSTVQYQNTLLLPFICQGHGVPLHELDMIWCYDSLHTCRAISHGGIIYFASLESWSFLKSGQDSFPTVSRSAIVVSEGTHEFAHRPVWKEENAAPDLQRAGWLWKSLYKSWDPLLDVLIWNLIEVRRF